MITIKKLALTLLALMLTISHLKGQTEKMISLSFSPNDFYITYNDDETANILSKKYDLCYPSDTLNPALPSINVNVLIRPNEDFQGFTETKKSLKLFSKNTKVAQNSFTISNRYAGIKHPTNTSPYSQKIYPTYSVEYTGCHNMDGYRFLSFSICPFHYNTDLDRIYVYSNISIEISLRPTLDSAKHNNNTQLIRTGHNMRECVSNFIVNKEEMDTYYSSTPLLENNSTAFLIITSDALKPSFQRLVDWKRMKGCSTDILSTEEINQTYSGNYLPLKIKRAIKNYYDNGLKYVFLAGDINVIPSPYCQYTLPVSGSPTEITPVDIYYSCMDDPLDWNIADSIFYCQTINTSSIDLAPEIAIGRLPVNTTTDAEYFVDRIINYEKGINVNYKNNLLLCGVLGDNFGNGSSTAERLCRHTYNDSILDIWNGNVTHFYDSHTDFQGDGAYPLNGTNLQTELTKGYSFFYENSHGASSEWQLEW